MTDRDALLAAITADPDDDTPRLVYADWLDEHGEGGRAEFVRVQCRLERVSRRSTEGKRLASRERELKARLFGHLSRLGLTDVTFRRGFVDRITSGLLALRDNLQRLDPADAPAYELRIGWGEAEEARYDDYEFQSRVTDEVFAEAAVRRCVALDLPCLGMDPSSYLLGSEQLTNLRRLNFPSNEAGPCIESVAAPTFANLRWACFANSNSAGGRPSIVPLAESPHLANLEFLDFSSNALVDADARAVASASQWARLGFLSVSSGWFSAEGVAAIFATPHLPALAELDLSHSFQDEDNADTYLEAVAGSPLFARLTKLSLQGNGITDAGAKALASAPPVVKLERLDLRNNPIGATGRAALAGRFGKGVCVFDGGDR